MADKLFHVHDALLGYVPRAGHCEPGRTIDVHGLRDNGKATPVASGERPILAVGDSFTFGEEVGDGDTWPAQLQQLIGRRVLNGGVSGYGLDQIVLHAEQLTAVHRPSVVVVSFIADDIRRAEMRRLWGYDKPWFAIEHDRLVLKGVPVPHRTRPLLDLRLVERLLLAFTPAWVQHCVGYHVRVHRAGTGLMIARRLTERLAALQASSGAKVIVLAQYHPQVWDDRAFANAQRGLAQVVLDGAADHGLAALDSFAALAAVPKPRRLYRTLHLSRRGNLLIARLVAGALRKQWSAAGGRS
jgi:lysophospholipase L1-like esterase